MDIGRSTVAHRPDRECFFQDGHNALVNWGNWHQSLRGVLLGYPPSPMFKEYQSGYPVTRGLPPLYNEERAIELEKKIASKMDKREGVVLHCEYDYLYSTRQAASYLRRKGYRCNHNKYISWLDAAVGRVDMIIGE